MSSKLNLSRNVTSSVFIDPSRGFGIRFNASYERDKICFEDEPLYSFLHYYSIKCALVCDSCYKVLGTLADNLNHILKICDKKIDGDSLDTLLSISRNYQIPNSVDFIECPSKCGAHFCSRECLSNSTTIHKFICTAFDDEERWKWHLFRKHAILNYESLYFVGIIHTSILADYILHGVPIRAGISRMGKFYRRRWDTLGCNADKDASMCVDSLGLLKYTLRRFIHNLGDGNADVSELFSIECFLESLGMVDLVAVDIEIPNGNGALLEEMFGEETGREAIEAVGEHLCLAYKMVTGCEEKVDLEEVIKNRSLFPVVMGLGIYHNISKMNHSCDPTLEVDYDVDNVAKIKLLRDVEKGEECTISYIDETDSYLKRQYELNNKYGFRCKCVRCTRDASCDE